MNIPSIAVTVDTADLSFTYKSKVCNEISAKKKIQISKVAAHTNNIYFWKRDRELFRWECNWLRLATAARWCHVTYFIFTSQKMCCISLKIFNCFMIWESVCLILKVFLGYLFRWNVVHNVLDDNFWHE